MSRSSFLTTYGPWALVTGASDGIGAEIAQDAARRGLNVVLVARRNDRLITLAEQLSRAFDINVHVVVADLGMPEGIQTVLDQTVDLEIGLLANCAGFGTSGRFVATALETDLNMIDVNCRAVAALTHPIARAMVERGRGGIVLMSSIVAFQGVAYSANYAATKAYVQTFAEGLRAELEQSGVDVLASAPGPVASGFAERADMRMGNAARPDVVARATLDALGRTGTVHPGGLAKLLGYNLALLPRWGRSAIMRQIMRGMTRHQDAEARPS
ncbi:MAG: SDR family oxidoreductase [Pseudomonadota bacterium]